MIKWSVGIKYLNGLLSKPKWKLIIQELDAVKCYVRQAGLSSQYVNPTPEAIKLNGQISSDLPGFESPIPFVSKTSI